MRSIARRSMGIVAAPVAALVIAGCGSGSLIPSLGHPAHATPSPNLSDLAKYQAVVVCARQHGLPNVPDAHLDDHGQPQFPNIGGKPPQSVLDGCKDLIAALPPNQAQTTRATLSAADLAKVKQFAACVRQHGYPAFPDPGADGSFVVTANTAGMPSKDSPAFQGCRHFLPNVPR